MALKARRYRPWCKVSCPHCDQEVGVYIFGGMSDMAPHFYCDQCSNVLFRESDRRLLYECDKANQELLERISATLPKCPCGGRFRPGQNFMCPKCRKSFTNAEDPVNRLTDPKPVVISGAKLVTEESDE